LKPEGLTPRDDNGRADLLLIAAYMKWMGVWFSELSFSIALADDAPGKMYLLYAFNSIPWFAWSERMFFKTPYYAGQTHLHAQAPAKIELAIQGMTQLTATMPSAREPAWRGEETWEGAIMLPRALSRTTTSEKRFYARLSGLTEIYPFVETDQFTLSSKASTPIVQWLRDSQCVGKEWHLRATARHEKSETL
jgi:hypothetical protein